MSEHTWRVELSGHRFDLAELVFQMQGTVAKSENKYWLTDSTLDEFEPSESALVLERARSIIELLNSSAKLLVSSFQPVTLQGLQRRSDKGWGTVLLIDSAVHSMRVREPSIGSRSPGKLVDALALARADARVEVVLRLLDFKPLLFWSLYKAFELIKSDLEAGGSDVTVLAPKAQWDRFRTSANHSSSGFAARQAESREAPHPNPMDLTEAEAFVRTAVKEWVLSLV